jgi:hypothetical protein
MLNNVVIKERKGKINIDNQCIRKDEKTREGKML